MQIETPEKKEGGAHPMHRPGVDPNWVAQNNLAKKYKPHYVAEGQGLMATSEVRGLLAFCADCEDTDEILKKTSILPSGMPDKQWWKWLPGRCELYAVHMLDHLQATALAEDRWDHAQASSFADALELATLIHLRGRLLDYQRGESFFFRGPPGIPYGVLALLIEGQTERALALANATVSAVQWGEYKPLLSHFTSTFMYSMLADFLGRKFVTPEVPKASGKAFDPQPYFHRLLAEWRTPDPGKLEELLLAACDCHTQIAWHGKKSEEREFTNGFWTRVPLIVFLTFKLRELKGLPNPSLSHPLMESALGRIPQPGYVPDPIIAKLRKRVDEGGVNIEETLAFYRSETLPPRPAS